MSAAASNSSLFLFTGFGQGSVPILGNRALRVQPLFPVPLGPFPLDANGDLLLQTTFPAPLPAPFTLTLQAFEIDPFVAHA